MANLIGTRVWVLDTASTTAVLWPNPIRIKLVEYFKPTNIGDTFTLNDVNGNEIVKGTCEVALQSQLFNLDNWYNGIILHDLTAGGLVKIHIR